MQPLIGPAGWLAAPPSCCRLGSMLLDPGRPATSPAGSGQSHGADDGDSSPEQRFRARLLQLTGAEKSGTGTGGSQQPRQSPRRVEREWGRLERSLAVVRWQGARGDTGGWPGVWAAALAWLHAWLALHEAPAPVGTPAADCQLAPLDGGQSTCAAPLPCRPTLSRPCRGCAPSRAPTWMPTRRSNVSCSYSATRSLQWSRPAPSAACGSCWREWVGRRSTLRASGL